MSGALVRKLLTKRWYGLLQQTRAYCYEGDGKTSVTILNHEVDSPLMVDAYHQSGFTLNNGMAVVGPIALFPKTVLAWDVKSALDVNLDSLSLFLLMEPKLDILIIGLGDKVNQIDPTILSQIRSKGISIEVLATEHACTTFNFLTVEKRAVAAALIPPSGTKPLTQDTQARKESEDRSA